MNTIELKLGVTLPSHVFNIIEKQIQVFYSELMSSMIKNESVSSTPKMTTFVPKVKIVNGTTFVSAVLGFGDDKYELELVVPAEQITNVNDNITNRSDVDASDHSDQALTQFLPIPLPGDITNNAVACTEDSNVQHMRIAAAEDVFHETKKTLEVDASIKMEVDETMGSHIKDNKRKSDRNKHGGNSKSKVGNNDAGNETNSDIVEDNPTCVLEANKSSRKCKRNVPKRKYCLKEVTISTTVRTDTKKHNVGQERHKCEDKTEMMSKGQTCGNDQMVHDHDIDSGDETETYSVHSIDVGYELDKKCGESLDESKVKKKTNQRKSKHQRKHKACGLSHDKASTKKAIKKTKYKRAGQPKFKCEHCKVMPFNSQEALQKHIARHNFETLPNADGLFTCEQCQKMFKSRANLTTHLWIHKERRFHCSDCSKKFVQKIQLQVHRTNVHLKLKPYLCIYCGKSFSQQSGLSYHLGTHEADDIKDKVTKELAKESHGLHKSNTDEDKKKKLFCIVCKVQFTNTVRWFYHLKSHLESDVKIESNMKENIEGILRDNENFLKSRRIYECHICDHVSFNSSENNLHKAVHVLEKTFACPHCNQKFSRDSNLKYHVRRIHRRLKCEICDARFGTNNGLTEHQAQLHGLDTLGVYNSNHCHICEYKTKQKFRLLFHLDKVHGIRNPNEHNFTCSWCGKIFATKYGLQLHQRIHTNERPFVCVVCDKSYSDPSNLIHHGNKAHPDVPKKTFLKRKTLL